MRIFFQTEIKAFFPAIDLFKMGRMLRHFVSGVTMVLIGTVFAGCASTSKQTITEEQSSSTLTFRKGDARVVTYNIKPPVNSGLPVESGDYFHPFTTPAGEVLTDFAPTDHKHHRGVFLACVEMHGEKDADFWGWGEHAPIKDRGLKWWRLMRSKRNRTERALWRIANGGRRERF